MNNLWLRISVGVGTVLFIVFASVYVLFESKDGGGSKAYARTPTPSSAESSASDSSEIELVCELAIDAKGAKTLGIDASEPAKVTMAKIDFEKKSGWYQGNISISEGRAGTLAVNGPILKVYRPAMFQRFGRSVNGEEFTIDRKTGQFKEYLSFSGGEKVNLISGLCAKVIRAPF